MSTKIHTLVNSLGLPIRFILTPGQVNDITQAEALLRGQKASFVLGDKAYDQDAFIAQIQNEVGAQAVIPPRSHRKEQRLYDKDIYKDRNLIERSFNQLKDFRRIATRFDKRATNFMAMVYLGAIWMWLK